MFIKAKRDPRIKSVSLGPHEKDDAKKLPSSSKGKQKAEFRPYGIPPRPILKKPEIDLPPLNIPPPMLPSPAAMAPRPTGPQPFQIYSDGDRVYLGPASAAAPIPTVQKPPLHKLRTFPSKKKMPPKKKAENPANFRIYPSNAGKTLLKTPPVTAKIGFDLPTNVSAAASITFQGFKPNSEPYNPIRVPTVSLMGMTSTTSLNPQLPPSNLSTTIRPQLFSSPPKTTTFSNKDDEIQAIKVVKHPIMRHHRSGGGNDIRKLREIYTNKKGALHHSTGFFSPNYNDETQSESETSMEIDSIEQMHDTVAEVVHFLLDSICGPQLDTVADVAEQKSSEIQQTHNIQKEHIFDEYLFNQSNKAIIQPETILSPPKKVTTEIPCVIIDDESPKLSRKSNRRNREDGELSRSPTPEIITIEDSDDDDDCIIEIKNPSPKTGYKGQGAFGLDLFLNNLGKDVSADAVEPVGIFFDMKLFYQNYEAILKRLIHENEERTKFAHGILDKLVEIGEPLEVYFLGGGDFLEESRADDDISEILVYITLVDENNANITSKLEPLYKILKDSKIENVSFCSNSNAIILIQDENTVAIRPLDKLSWLRSSLVCACGSKVPLFKNALLLIKKAIRQFKPSEELSDFIISFALINYFQNIVVFPTFDYDLEQFDIFSFIDVDVKKQPTKKANEIFSDFLFYIKHNEDLSIECPFTKEQMDIKDTILPNTVDLIFGK